MDLGVNFLSVSSAAHSVMYLSVDSAHLHYSWKVLTKNCPRKRSLSEKCRSQIHSKKYDVCECVLWSHPELARCQFRSFFSCSSVTISVLLPVGVTPHQLFVAVIPPKVQLYLHNPDLDATLLLLYYVFNQISIQDDTKTQPSSVSAAIPFALFCIPLIAFCSWVSLSHRTVALLFEIPPSFLLHPLV